MNDEQMQLAKLLYPWKNRSGRRPLIQKDKVEQTKEKERLSAARGFSFDINTIRHVMGK